MLIRIGQRIRTKRLAQAVNRCELARRAGLRPETLWRIENGHSVPRRRTAERIALALSVPLAELLGDEHAA